MKLKNISIQNFRSITSTEKLELSDYCILLGKNNEGKTNVLKALSFAMYAIRQIRVNGRRGAYRSENYYSFKRDYPVSLLEDKNAKPTSFVLTFQLSEEDIASFYETTKLHNNGYICVEIVFPKSDNSYDQPQIFLKEKRGRGGSSYKAHIQDILAFLLNNISFQYIPAVRTADNSFDVIRSLIRNVLYTLDEDDEYKSAIDLIVSKRNELVDKLGSVLKDKIKTFIPSVSDIEISLGSSRDLDIDFDDSIRFVIDDGNKTSIQYKGDGIKSLAALALLYSTKTAKQSQIIAIEEPESHLHYEAIHQIDAVLRDLSKTNQVIVTTHNPVFINKDDVTSNIIIDKGIGKKATSISEIRDLMGIRISDSLFYSDKVVLVEGEDDKISLSHIMSLLDLELGESIKKNEISFSAVGGASKLPYVCTLLSNWLVKYCAIVDYDKAGMASLNNCLNKGFLTPKNSYSPIAFNSKKENEFEDFLNVEIYKNYIFDNYGVSVECARFNKKNKKWSDRLSDAFAESGKLLDETTKAIIKTNIAKIISLKNDINQILLPSYITIFQNIASSIKKELL